MRASITPDRPDRPRFRVWRWIGVGTAGLVLVVLLAIGLVRLRYHGEALGENLSASISDGMRGRLEIGSVEWPMSSLPALVSGGWVPVTLRDVKVWDDAPLRDPAHKAPRALVLETKLITGEIDLHSLIFGHHDFVFRKVRVHGGRVTIENVDEPYPLHAYDKVIVSLVSAFYPVRKPGYGAGISASSGAAWDLRDFTIAGVTLEVLIGQFNDPRKVSRHVAAVTADQVNATGSLFFDPSDPLVPKFYFQLAARGGATVIRTDAAAADPNDADLRLDFKYLTASLAQLPTGWPRTAVANTLSLHVATETTEGGTLNVDGDIIDYWDRPYDGTWALSITGKKLGDTLNQRINQILGGDDLSARVTIAGPFLAEPLPRVEFVLTGLEANIPLTRDQHPLELALDQFRGAVDFVNSQGTIDETVARSKQGGALTLAATFAFDPKRVDATVRITEPINLRPWLPADVAGAIGTKLSGSIHGYGNTEEKFQLDDIGLHLGRAHLDDGTITSEPSLAKIKLKGLRVRLDQTRANLDGEIDTAAQAMTISAKDVRAEDLGAWLARFGKPRLARTAHGEAQVSLSWKPDGKREGASITEASGDLTFGGVPSVGTVALDMSVKNDLLTVDAATTRSLGGSLHGKGRVRLQSRWIDNFELQAQDVDLGQVPGSPLGGKVNADLALRGPADLFRIEGEGTLTAERVDAYGQTLTDVAMCFGAKAEAQCRAREPAFASDPLLCPGKTRCGLFTFDRKGGGSAAIAVADRKGDLTGAAHLTRFPIAAVMQAAGLDLPAGGTASMDLRLGGNLQSPTFDGTVSLIRGWVMAAFVGDASFEVQRADDDKIRVRGELLGGRLGVELVVTTHGDYQTTATLQLRRVELDPFLDLAGMIGAPEGSVHVWATGTATITTALRAPAGTPPVSANLNLTELAATIDRLRGDGRPTPLSIRAAQPFSVSWDGKHATIGCADGGAPDGKGCAAVLATPAGALRLEGGAGLERLDLRVNGVLDAALVAPLLADYIDESGGTAELEARLTGTRQQPVVDATVSINDVWLRPARQDTVLRLEQGTIGLRNNDSLSVTGVALRVEDNFKDNEAGTLEIKGGIKLSRFAPVEWGLIVEGELSGKLLVAATARQETPPFSRADGMATISAVLSGRGLMPSIYATVEFAPKSPLALIPRGLRREITLSSGSVILSDASGSSGGDPCQGDAPMASSSSGLSRRYRLDFCDIAGSIDSDGRFRNIRGTIDLDGFALAGGDVTFEADELPFRIPRTLDLVVNMRGMRVSRDELAGGRWGVEGSIELVSGRYTSYIQIGELIRSQAMPQVAPATPFWEEYPALGSAELDLSFLIAKFTVAMDIGEIELAGSTRITGTPKDPRFDGSIRVQRGVLRLPGSRPVFENTIGELKFQPLQRFPDNTPDIDLTSRANFQDTTGQEHLITFTLRGTLSRPTWDLFTSTGYNKAQTSMLIYGYKPKDQRAEIDLRPDNVQLSSAQSTTDEIMKDITGAYISQQIGEPLRAVTGIDVLDIKLTLRSIGAHAEEKILDSLSVKADVEQTNVASTVNIRGDWRTPLRLSPRHGYLSLQLGYLLKDFEDAAEPPVEDGEFKMVYRITIP